MNSSYDIKFHIAALPAVFVLAALFLTIPAKEGFIIPSARAAAIINVNGGCSDATPATPICDDGATYRTIQGAIDAAAAGDIIQVASGTYKEQLIVDKSLTLQGAGASNSSIQLPENPAANSAGSCLRSQCISLVLVRSGTVAIRGFLIQGHLHIAGDQSQRFLIEIIAGEAIVEDNVLDGLDPFQEFIESFAIYQAGNANITVQRNTIRHFQLAGVAAGYNLVSGTAVVDNNEFIGDGLSGGGAQAAVLFNAPGGRITGNTIRGVPTAYPIIFRPIQPVTVASNTNVDAPSLKSDLRSSIDMADDIAGSQVHLMYVLPSDGIDESLDINNRITASVSAFQKWLYGKTNGRRLRIDTYKGALDITFFRLSRTDAEMQSYGSGTLSQIESEIRSAGFNQPNKIYSVYYGGGSTYACGNGAWPPELPGSTSVGFLNARPVPSFPCPPLTFSENVVGYFEIAMLHEAMHTMGFVASCAPNHNRTATQAGHVKDDPLDLMFSGSTPVSWGSFLTLDTNRDDYYEHSNGSCFDFADSPYLSSGAPDATPPSVSITSPASGASVSGTITVSASASDSVGVSGVQFTLDGANLGAEDTASPYSIAWNTTAATNGSHSLTAVARDPSGNQKTSDPVAVTVSNAVSDTTAPSTPANLAATAVSSSQINLTWNASTDALGVTGYRVYRSGTQIASPSGTSYSDTGLSPSTPYAYTVAAVDAAGNVSNESAGKSATTLTSDGGLMTNTAYSYRVTFRNAAGAAIESVTGMFTTTNCLSVTCSASPASIETGQNVTWTASASGGPDPYSYSWSGDSPLEGQTGNPVSVTYSTSGTKTGSVRATSGGLSATQACYNSVSVGGVNRPPDNPGGGGGGGGGGSVGCSGNTGGNPDACGGGIIIPPGNPANSNPGTASFGESTAGICTAPLQPTLSWTYSDPDGDSQSAYQIQVDQIQVDTNSSFESPLILDTGKTLSGIASYFYPTSCSFCSVFNVLTYNNTYHWRVRVWDSKGAISNWAEGDTFATQPHAAPPAPYSWNPLNPNANQPTDFTPQTQGASYTYSWTFQDGDPSFSSDAKPRKVKFLSIGAKNTSLIIKDSDNLSCGAQRTINVGGTPTTPGWIEIPPE